MGSADIIPGVSGGTIALIAGIYQKLMQAIQSFNSRTIAHLFRFQWKEALSTVHLRFLLTLFGGIVIAIVSIARIMNYLLHEQAILTWSLFFGLILASILILGRNIKHWMGLEGLSLLVGALAAYFLVGVIPVETPESLWFILLSGMIAICAMILPGISGAFILLILGKYEFVTNAIKHPFSLENMAVILVFCVGCLFGLLSFSRVLSFFLDRYQAITLALLTGLMCGSMRKVWPWKEVLESKVIRGKVHVLRESNILPSVFDTQLLLAICLMGIGFLLILFMERQANTQGSGIRH